MHGKEIIMKNKYEEPCVQIVCLELEDVITSSNPNEENWTFDY